MLNNVDFAVNKNKTNIKKRMANDDEVISRYF